MGMLRLTRRRIWKFVLSICAIGLFFLITKHAGRVASSKLVRNIPFKLPRHAVALDSGIFYDYSRDGGGRSKLDFEAVFSKSEGLPWPTLDVPAMSHCECVFF